MRDNPEKLTAIKKFSKQSGEVYLVQGKIDDIYIWRYILVEPLKISLFERALKTGIIVPNEYGKLLYYGDGISPPKHIEDKISEEYN